MAYRFEHINTTLYFFMKPIVDTSALQEHSLVILRRDFITASHCAFCPRKLPTNKALILAHPELGKVAAGPQCGPRWGIKPSEGLLDFTRRGMEEDAIPPASAEQTLNEQMPERTGKTRTRVRAIEYLLLRTEKLPPLGFKNIARRELDALYSVHRTRPLNDEEISRIQVIMKNCATHTDPDIKTRSYDSLMLAYTHAYWIDRCLEIGGRKLSLQNAERLDSFRKGLQRYRSLTIRQIEQLNRDLAYVFGEQAPKLKPDAFVPFRPGAGNVQQTRSPRFHNDKVS